MIRFLDKKGKLINADYKPTEAQKKQLLAMYKIMVRSRQWDNYSLTLQKTGRLGTFAPNLGEEAALAAIGYNLKKDDWYAPHYRALPTLLARGVEMKSIYAYWNGSELGSKMPGLNTLPMQVIIGSQTSMAGGVASALKANGKGQICLTTIGNGGTNEGEFHEGLNMASVRNWPLVMVVMNNQWAISVPEHHSYKVKTLSQRAMSYGIPSVRVDGNDLLATSEVIKEAYEYTRKGNGPILIEMLTWRQGQHTTSDNPRVYRSREEEEKHEEWEPFHRIEAYLLKEKIITKDQIEALAQEAEAEAKQAYADSAAILSSEGFDDIYDYTYETMPAELAEQKEANRRFLK
ncbi:thiamine pyrophosphate-dependent enzyme [Mycoplasmopsis primatum]|uniref:thiamine pyrophosphate-dependent enzyme n=1 Tax=Mycoplasmopsis primatum TaxID=55604 RepID=UPI000B0B287C|nr:thiamine pyrophosphate-dependent enzyme [Mycoplasmopsis primatum]